MNDTNDTPFIIIFSATVMPLAGVGTYGDTFAADIASGIKLQDGVTDESKPS